MNTDGMGCPREVDSESPVPLFFAATWFLAGHWIFPVEDRRLCASWARTDSRNNGASVLTAADQLAFPRMRCPAPESPVSEETIH